MLKDESASETFTLQPTSARTPLLAASTRTVTPAFAPCVGACGQKETNRRDLHCFLYPIAVERLVANHMPKARSTKASHCTRNLSWAVYGRTQLSGLSFSRE